MTRAAFAGFTDKTGYELACGLVLLALLALRLLANAVGHTNLVFDEAQYWTWSKDLAFGYYSKPPMIAWAIRAATTMCGDGEACVRSMSPAIHTLTAWFVFLTGRLLYDARTGFWSAVVYATLPGVSFSSTLASTDVPLLLFWSVALYCYIRLLETPSLGLAAALGCALGLGMLSKYAAIYFVLCAALHAALSPRARDALRGYRGLVVLLIMAAFLLPNVAWNAQHDFVTLKHTKDNANWSGLPAHPLNMLEFVGGQFGLGGPIVFGAWLWATWRALMERDANDTTRLLLAFSAPMLVLNTVQAFLSRAHANWAAAAYPAVAILATAILLRNIRLFQISLGLNLATALVIAFGPVFAPRLAPRIAASVYGRVFGWSEIAQGVTERREQAAAPTILTDDRAVISELLYYMRDVLEAQSIDVRYWKPRPETVNHFQITRPFTGAEQGPVLYVTDRAVSNAVTDRFATVEPLPPVESAMGGKKRTLYVFRLDGFRSYAQ